MHVRLLSMAVSCKRIQMKNQGEYRVKSQLFALVFVMIAQTLLNCEASGLF